MRVCEERGWSAESETSFPNKVIGAALSEPEGSSISCSHRVYREILSVFVCRADCTCVYMILDEWSLHMQFTVCVCVCAGDAAGFLWKWSSI